MATVNKRTSNPQASVINGIDTGGTMSASITEGFENKMQSAPDGLTLPVKDKEIQFCRGVVATQDWAVVISILTGTLGTYVFYERMSGVAEANGYIKHTITNPVIHNVRFSLTKEGYAVATFAFECRAADETKGFADMHVPLDAQAAPSYIAAARGGFRIISTTHGTGGSTINLYHITGFDFTITLPLAKACNDADIGYTCVDARLDGMTAEGSIGFQDSEVTGGATKSQQLLAAAKGPLVLTVAQGQGAANKVITTANVDFDSVGGNAANSARGTNYTGHTAAFDVANDAGTPLTLAGDNKIITIANAV